VGAFLWQHGEAVEAVAFTRHAIWLAEATKNYGELRRHYCGLGNLYTDSGEFGLATQAFLDSILVAQRIDDKRGECLAWNNISALFIDAGLFRESIACATHCVRLVAQNCFDKAELCNQAMNNIALAHLRLGNHDLALSILRPLVARAREPRTVLEAARRVVRERNLVLALIANSEVSEAGRHIIESQRIVALFPSPRQELLVDTVNGLFCVLVGDPTSGIRILEQAAELARSSTPSAIPDTLWGLAIAYQEVDDCERALKVTHALKDHLAEKHVSQALARLATLQSSADISLPESSSNMAELERMEAGLRSRVLQRELVRTRQEMLERMAVVADIREDASGEHGYRVGCLSALLAKEIGWCRDDCDAIDISARLHDIGKIAIPERLLFGRRSLQDTEWHLIANHTRVGAEILSKSEIPQVRLAEEIARCHHEWWNGSGYPNGMKGLAIPQSARIVALADAFDAMTHGRPYAPVMPVERALEEIAALSGRQFDPELTDHFLVLVRRLLADSKDLDAYLDRAARNSPFLKARARIRDMLAVDSDFAEMSHDGRISPTSSN
jgi:putative two-component system response regulator